MSKKMIFACAFLCGAACMQAEEAKVQTAPCVKAESDTLYVNLQEAMLRSKQGDEAQKIVGAEQQRYTEQVQKAQQDMIKLKTDLDQKASMMSPEALRMQEKRIADMQRDLQILAKDAEYEIQLVMQRETDMIIKDIEESARELAEKTKKNKIIDAQSGRAIYLHPDYDDTHQLINVMNNKFDAKKKPAPALAK